MAGELELVGVTKAFQGHNVVTDVSLRIEQGQFVCFLGPSGCGKTTLLRIIAGLEVPTSGRILLNGRNITALPAHQRNFGMVFQALALFPHLDVAGNIAYALRLRNLDARGRKERIEELLELVHLAGAGKRSVDQLSGGQRQRVAIARALAQEPRLFLMDEPFSALDALLRDHMQVEIRQLQKQLKITTIFVTHDQKEAMTIADQVIVISEGRAQQVGPPVEVYRRPANRFVASFIGQSNLIDVEVVAPGAVRFRDAIMSVAEMPAGLAAGSRATLCIRPENVQLASRGDAGSGLAGEVAFVRDLGSTVEVRIDCGGSNIAAAIPPLDWARLSSHREVSLAFAPEAATVLVN